MNMTESRCNWVKNDKLMIDYHDKEWGVPVHDDKKLFEFLVLDTFQAGLSWQIILHKRDNLRKAFDNFNYKMIAKYDENKMNQLINDSSIIRNKLKIIATINNAQRFLKVQKEFCTFDTYIWQFSNFKTIVNHYDKPSDIPTKTKLSDKMSLDLSNRGFKFVGSTICYAFMQAIGMVNDHLVTCYRYEEINNLL